MRPTVLTQTLKWKLSDHNNPNRNGVWLKLILPPDVADQDVLIYPVMVTEGSWFSRARQAGYRKDMYANYFADGNWVALEEIGQWDALDVRQYRHLPPAQYMAIDWRVWLVHLPDSRGMDRLELEIHYPSAIMNRPDNLGYRFSIELNGVKTGGLHENPYINEQLAEPDENVKLLVIDSIPVGSRNAVFLGVI